MVTGARGAIPPLLLSLSVFALTPLAVFIIYKQMIQLTRMSQQHNADYVTMTLRLLSGIHAHDMRSAVAVVQQAVDLAQPAGADAESMQSTNERLEFFEGTCSLAYMLRKLTSI